MERKRNFGAMIYFRILSVNVRAEETAVSAKISALKLSGYFTA